MKTELSEESKSPKKMARGLSLGVAIGLLPILLHYFGVIDLLMTLVLTAAIMTGTQKTLKRIILTYMGMVAGGLAVIFLVSLVYFGYGKSNEFYQKHLMLSEKFPEYIEGIEEVYKGDVKVVDAKLEGTGLGIEDQNLDFIIRPALKLLFDVPEGADPAYIIRLAHLRAAMNISIMPKSMEVEIEAFKAAGREAELVDMLLARMIFCHFDGDGELVAANSVQPFGINALDVPMMAPIVNSCKIVQERLASGDLQVESKMGEEKSTEVPAQ